MSFFGWEFLIFYIPMCVALLIGLGGAIGLINIDLDIDHDWEAPEIDDGELHETLEAKGSILELFGFGKVPLSIIMVTAQMVFGTIGICSNIILQPILRVPIIYGLISIGVALVGMFFFTGVICRTLAKVMPSSETYVRGAEDLVGRTGEAYTSISTGGGVAQVRDANLTLHKIQCRTYDGRIEVGKEILVTEYDRDKKEYTVDKAPPL